MIQDWCEVDTEAFEDIFKLFWEGYGESVNKVIEVQNIYELKLNNPTHRMYLGYGIKLREWQSCNKNSLGVLSSINEFLPGIYEDIVNRNKISECVLTEIGPNIVPLGLDGHYKLLEVNLLGKDNNSLDKDAWKVCFDTRYWFIKDGKYRIRCPYEDTKDLTGKDKFLRIRGMDIEDWKQMMKDYIETGNIESLHIENDLKKRYIRI